MFIYVRMWREKCLKDSTSIRQSVHSNYLQFIIEKAKAIVYAVTDKAVWIFQFGVSGFKERAVHIGRRT